MKKILAFSGSLSSDSINHQLIDYTASQVENHEVNIIRLSDFPMPLYSSDIERDEGIPEQTQRLRQLFDETDAFIISSPEYNSSVPAGLKNALDWISRTGGQTFQDKPVLLMAASPGGRGGASVLEHLAATIPYRGADLVGTFSLPKFGENFSEGKFVNDELKSQLHEELTKLIGKLF